MKKVESDLEDELRPEYDLRSLRVRKIGPGRKSFGDVVRLEPDVADAFPDADAVNQALRFLIRVTKENQNALRPTKGDAYKRLQRTGISVPLIDNLPHDAVVARR